MAENSNIFDSIHQVQEKMNLINEKVKLVEKQGQAYKIIVDSMGKQMEAFVDISEAQSMTEFNEAVSKNSTTLH